jgi:hypothetical protein
MTFAQFIAQTRVTDSPRGRLIADLKAHGCADIECWPALYRAVRSADIMLARQLWWAYRKSETAAARSRLRETRTNETRLRKPRGW